MSSFTFFSPGKPATKQRPRMTRRGRVYTPEATTLAENAIRSDYERAGGPTYEGPVRVMVEYRKEGQIITVTEVEDFANQSKLRGDLDNYLKLTLDGLQGEGGAFLNDRQVVSITAIRR